MISIALRRAKTELRNAIHTGYGIERKAEDYLLALREYRQNLGQTIGLVLQDGAPDWAPALRSRKTSIPRKGATGQYLKLRVSA